MLEIAKDNLECYIANGYNGTNVQDVNDGIANAAPLPGNQNRGDWRPYYKPYGPVGILLLQLNEKASALSKDFSLHTHGWPETNLITCPHQELKPTIARTAINARTKAQCNTRKSNANLHEIDRIATNHGTKKREKGDLGLLRLVQ